MANSIKARVLIKNSVQLLDQTVYEHLICSNLSFIALYWLVPVVSNGILQHYKPVISDTKPTVDSVNSVKVKDSETHHTYFVALGDAATMADVPAKCNECCDAITELPAVTVPGVLLEEIGCGNDTDGYVYTDHPVALQGAEVYLAEGSLEGVKFTGASGAGHVSVAAFVTWANTNWSAYGTFAYAAGALTLTSADKTTGYIKLVPTTL